MQQLHFVCSFVVLKHEDFKDLIIPYQYSKYAKKGGNSAWYDLTKHVFFLAFV